MPDAKRKQANGFTLIELLVVVAIMMVLIGMIMGAASLVRKQREKVLAAKQVNDIAAAAEAYFMMMHQYPPDTGWVEADGSTTAFPTTPADPPEANSIFMYLGRNIYESETDTKYSGFLVIHMQHLRQLGSVKDVMVDPCGMPYCMDNVHVSMGEGAVVTGNKTGYVARDVDIQRLGAPYDPATPIENQLLTVKVWSAGPDKKEGAKPFSHVNAPTAPEDEDNISNWR